MSSTPPAPASAHFRPKIINQYLRLFSEKAEAIRQHSAQVFVDAGILQDMTSQRTYVVFGARGAGKTSLRFELSRRIGRQRLVAELTRFPWVQPPSTNHIYPADIYIPAVCHAVLHALREQVKKKEQIQKALLSHSGAVTTCWAAQQQCRPHDFGLVPDDPFSAVEQQKVLDRVSRLMLHEWLRSLADMARSAGFKGITVLVDPEYNDNAPALTHSAVYPDLPNQVLRSSIDMRYNESELRTLIFDLDIDYGAFLGRDKSTLIVELIEYCRRKGKMRQLIEAIKPPAPDPTASPTLGENAGSHLSREIATTIALLLDNGHVMDLEDVEFKWFLRADLKAHLSPPRLREWGVHYRDLEWKYEHLEKLLRHRLSIPSGSNTRSRPLSFRDLCVADAALEDVEQRLIEHANASPRLLVWLVHEIVWEHSRSGNPAGLIEHATVQAVLDRAH